MCTKQVLVQPSIPPRPVCHQVLTLPQSPPLFAEADSGKEDVLGKTQPTSQAFAKLLPSPDPHYPHTLSPNLHLQLTQGMPCTQCKFLYVGNYWNPSFGLFAPVGCSITDIFTLLVDGGCGTFELPPIFYPLFANLAHFYPVLLRVPCYRWMQDCDDGELPDVMYIYNATNQQVGCYTLQSESQPSWSLLCYL